MADKSGLEWERALAWEGMDDDLEVEVATDGPDDRPADYEPRDEKWLWLSQGFDAIAFPARLWPELRDSVDRKLAGPTLLEALQEIRTAREGN